MRMMLPDIDCNSTCHRVTSLWLGSCWQTTQTAGEVGAQGMVRYFVFIERICSRLNRHISHIKTHEFHRNGENDQKRRLFQFLLQIWLTLACKIHSDLRTLRSGSQINDCNYRFLRRLLSDRSIDNCGIVRFISQPSSITINMGMGRGRSPPLLS